MAPTLGREPDFGPEWERYCTIERGLWIGYIGGAIGLGACLLLGRGSETMFNVGIGGCVVMLMALVVGRLHATTLRCPYCGGPFYDSYSLSRSLPATCLTCGAERPSIWRAPPNKRLEPTRRKD